MFHRPQKGKVLPTRKSVKLGFVQRACVSHAFAELISVAWKKVPETVVQDSNNCRITIARKAQRTIVSWRSGLVLDSKLEEPVD